MTKTLEDLEANEEEVMEILKDIPLTEYLETFLSINDHSMFANYSTAQAIETMTSETFSRILGEEPRDTLSIMSGLFLYGFILGFNFAEHDA